MFIYKKKIILSKEQERIIEWIVRHSRDTAYSTWNILFNERKSDAPDECIALYDELSIKEKREVELITARFFSIPNHYTLSIKYVFKQLSYE